MANADYWRGRAEALELSLRLMAENRAAPVAAVGGAEPMGASADAIMRALRSLRPKQFAVLQLMSDGLIDGEICEALDIRPETVRGHVRAVMKALRRETNKSIPRRTEMIAMIAPVIEAMTPEEYEAMSLIPKNWSKLKKRSEKTLWPAIFLNTVRDEEDVDAS